VSKKRGLPNQVEMRHDAHYVDTLTKRFEHHVGKYVPIEAIDPNPDQPRTHLGDLSDLKASILAKGILEPLLVRAHGENRYQIIAGERRYHAALEAELEEVPVVEINADDAEVMEIALIENLQRKDLTPFEEADGFAKMMERYGYTQEKLAEVIGKSRSSIAETTRIRRIPESIRELCRLKEIEAKSILTEISRLESVEDMEHMIRAIASGELDRSGLRQEKKAIRQVSSSAPVVSRKPFVFRFAPKGSTFRFQLTFKKSDVSSGEILSTLEEIVTQLRSQGS